MVAAVVGEMAVVAIDHRDARPHEAGDREHWNAGAQRESGVRVPQVIEAADRVDSSLDLRRPPVLASEDAKVDPSAAHVRKQDRLSDAGSRSSASNAFACSGTARVLSRVFVCLMRPLA
ncbi:MAG TPA: hypothetical protein VGK68_01840 [Gaiellaceae bacterium]